MNVGPGQPHMHQAGHYGPPPPQASHAAHQPQAPHAAHQPQVPSVFKLSLFIIDFEYYLMRFKLFHYK